MSTRLPPEAKAQAQRCWSSSVAVHQQALRGSAQLLGGEDAAGGSCELLPHSCHGAPRPLAWRLWNKTLSHGRFLHKNPEDPSEVPGGFLSDLNPVSSWDYGPGGELGTSRTQAGGTYFHETPTPPWAGPCGERGWGEWGCGGGCGVHLSCLSLPGLPACGLQRHGRQLRPLCPAFRQVPV